jgi:uncharacterized protein YabE (DUF348 family)
MLKKFANLRLKFKVYRRLPWSQRVKHFKLMSRHPFAVPVITISVLIVLTGGIYIFAKQTHKLPPVHNAKIVIISHDHQQQVVPSKENTVGSLLQKLNIHLNQGDVVEPAANTPIDQDEFRINVYRSVPVQVVDGSNRTYSFSAAKTPRSIAQQAGSQLFPEDLVKTEPAQDFLRSGAVGEQIVIDRATPVNVDLYGTPIQLRTHAKTVGALIKEKHIKLIRGDRIDPAPSTPISANQHLAFIRTGTKTETVTEQIAMPVQAVNDSSLAYGTNAVRQQGSPGEQVVTYQIEIVNNVEKSRNTIQRIVTRVPVTQITAVGSSLSGIKGDMALAGIAPGDYPYADYIISHESGWCPTKAQGQYGGCPPYAGFVSSYGGYGLCQSTPGTKMATAGADWATNPVTQLRWCSGYAHAHYGGWHSAYSHWLSYHNW